MENQSNFFSIKKTRSHFFKDRSDSIHPEIKDFRMGCLASLLVIYNFLLIARILKPLLPNEHQDRIPRILAAHQPHSRLLITLFLNSEQDSLTIKFVSRQ